MRPARAALPALAGLLTTGCFHFTPEYPSARYVGLVRDPAQVEVVQIGGPPAQQAAILAPSDRPADPSR